MDDDEAEPRNDDDPFWRKVDEAWTAFKDDNLNNKEQTPMATEYNFQSSSGGGTYTAKVADDGKLLCNCKGWTMRRGDRARHCKHTKEIAAKLRRTVEERGEFAFLSEPDLGGNPGITINNSKTVIRPVVVDLAERVAPMLASPMIDAVVGPAFDRRYTAKEWVMEEKLDGHRCVAVVGVNRSVRAHSRPRAGDEPKSRELPDHILEQLACLPAGTYDGELLAPSGKSWDVPSVGSKLVYVIFDLLEVSPHGDIWPGDPRCNTAALPYDKRRQTLLDCLRLLPPGQKAVTSVLPMLPRWAEVQKVWKRGGEGVILKRRASIYRPGARTPDWLKVKQVHAATLRITGFAAGKSGPYSAIELEDDKGNLTTVKTLDNRMLRDIAKAPASFIGRSVVISFQERTPTGAYRHPMFDHFDEHFED